MFDDDELVELIPNLTLFAHKLAGDNADDLVQATLEKALAKRHQFIPGSTLIYWLNKLMHNTFLDGIRKQEGRSKHKVPVFVFREDDELYGPHQEDDIALVRAIDKLYSMSHDKALGIAMMASGYSCEEMAEATHRSVSTATNMVSRARKQLRKSILSEGDD